MSFSTVERVPFHPSSMISPLGTENQTHCEGGTSQMHGAACSPTQGCLTVPWPQPGPVPEGPSGGGGAAGTVGVGRGTPPASPFFLPVGKVVLVTGAASMLVILLGFFSLG